MTPGDLLYDPDGDRHLYRDIHGIFAGTFPKDALAIYLDRDFSSTGHVYYQVFVDGIVGWTKPEGLKVVTHETRRPPRTKVAR